MVKWISCSTAELLVDVGNLRYVAAMRLFLGWVFLSVVAGVSHFVLAPMAQGWADERAATFSLQEAGAFGELLLSGIAVPGLAWVIPLLCLGAGIGVTFNDGRTRR